MLVAAATSAASRRDVHEAHAIDEPGGMFAVVRAHHPRARAIVVEALRAHPPAQALDEASRRLQAHAGVEQSLAASATVLVLHGPRAQVVHLGVTCALRVRDGAVRRLTGDHAYRVAGAPPMLLSWLGQPSAAAEVGEDALLPGDRFVIASDAIPLAVDEAELIAIVLGEPAAAARTLVERARAAGHREATAIVVAAPARERL